MRCCLAAEAWLASYSSFRPMAVAASEKDRLASPRWPAGGARFEALAYLGIELIQPESFDPARTEAGTLEADTCYRRTENVSPD